MATTVDPRSWTAMKRHARRAVELAEAAAEREPGWVEPCVLQLEAARLLGDPELAERAWTRGFALAPASHSLWDALLDGLTRRWGGSYDQLEQAAASAQEHVAQNPRLRLLQARADADRAHDLRDANEYDVAVIHYDLALEHGEQAWLLGARGWTHYHAGSHSEALRDLERAVTLEPFVAGHHHRRAHVLMALDRHADAEAAAALSVELAPTDDHFAWVQQSAAAKHRKQAEWDAFVANPSAGEALRRGSRWLTTNALWSLLASGSLWATFHGWRLSRRRVASAEGEPPESSLAAPSAQRIARLLMRAYVWLMVFHHVSMYAELWDHADAIDLYVGRPMDAVGLLGAVAFAHGWRVASRDFWRLWAWLHPGWILVHWFGIEGSGLAEWLVWSFALLLLLPLFGMLFSYGYRSPEIWCRGDEPEPSGHALA